MNITSMLPAVAAGFLLSMTGPSESAFAAFCWEEGGLSVNGVAEGCVPQAELPVGIPRPDLSDPVNTPPAPPNIDDTVVPGGITPRTDDTVAGVADSASGAAFAPLGQDPECQPRWHYDIEKKLAPQFAPGNNRTYSFTNASDRVQSNALTATRSQSGKVSLSATAEVEVSASVIVSSVKTKFGVTVTGEIGWETSVSNTVAVGARKTGYLTYGVMRFVTVGHYYRTDQFCNITVDKGRLTVYSPYSEGAYYWEEGA